MILFTNDIRRGTCDRPRFYVARFLVVTIALANGFSIWNSAGLQADEPESQPKQSEIAANQPPNVLFIAVDDLNDWVGCLVGKSRCPNAQHGRLCQAQCAVSQRALPSRTLQCITHLGADRNVCIDDRDLWKQS